MIRKTKAKPILLLTREALEAAITDYARLKLEHLALTARMEAAKTAVEKRFQEELHGLAREIEARFAAVQNFCVMHRSELLPGDRKSFETVSATVRFYETPPRVEKRGRETLGSIAKRLLGLVFECRHPATGAVVETLDCARYVREPEPELNKEALLADRRKLDEAQLQAMGIRFAQDEIFAIEPHSEFVENATATVEPRLAA